VEPHLIHHQDYDVLWPEIFLVILPPHFGVD